jgi:hypothetical protein
MTFDEAVQILGRPLHMTTSGTISMLWRTGDRNTFVDLLFADGERGERMFYCCDGTPEPFSF